MWNCSKNYEKQIIMKNDFSYKWSKLFASKRYNTEDGVINLTPEEQQELLDDSERVVKNHSILDVVGQSEQLKCQCKKAKFTRTVDSDFNLLCGRCGKVL